MGDYKETYEIPESISSQLSDCFYMALCGELVSIFGVESMIPEFYEIPEDPHGTPTPFYPISYHSSTSGWNAAVYATCKKLGLMEVYDYYDHLHWYDSDRFDGIIEDEMCKRIPHIHASSNPYYQFLIHNDLKKMKEKTE